MTKLTFASVIVLPILALAVGAFSFWSRPHVAGIQSPVIIRPGQSIQAALSAAQPGATILVKPGTYTEKLVTVRSGTATAPITLWGEPGAVLAGGGDGRLMEIKHDYYRIGEFELKDADVLLWMQEADHNTITKNFFHHAKGECIRAKYQSSHNMFSNNRIENCGREDFADPSTGSGLTGKNGEGIYLGTAPEQLDKNPTGEIDQTSYNSIQHNVFKTNGNECVDIKEGSSYNVVEFNDCTGQKDPESGGFDARGNKNMFRYNKSYGNAGAGIRLGGDGQSDGINNVAYGNELTGNAGYAIKVMRSPQGKICGNTVVGNALGFTNESVITKLPCL